jgi:tetratricopeptide (TPR) repeat protein
LLILLVLLSWLWRSARSDELALSPGQIGVVILPLANASGDPANDWLARVTYALRGPDQRERRRSVVGADVTDLARAIGADLLALLGKGGRRLQDLDDFIDETYLRGRALRLRGDLQGADELFRIAAEQLPDAFWARYEYALSRRDLGDAARADALLAGLLERRASRDAGRLRAAANSCALAKAQAGARDDAAVLLDEALTAARASADVDAIATVLGNRSIVQRRLGHLEAARREARERASSFYGSADELANQLDVRISLARLERPAGQSTAAQEQVQAALIWAERHAHQPLR